MEYHEMNLSGTRSY